MEEILDISAGLVLPELYGLSLTEVLVKATKTHEVRTGVKVARHLGALPRTANRSTCICFYRFVQEGLNNAFHHALGASCSVTAYSTASAIEVKVSNDGSGFDPSTIERKGSSSGLGLAGLRERIESLGGTFEIQSTIDLGTVLTANFSIADLEIEDGE